MDALISSKDIEVVGAVTNPDKPSGRGLELRPSPVKARAIEAGLPVRQPASARDPDLEGWLADRAVDVVVVVAYGKILPASLLAVPPKGFVNVHFSILPEYRGAAPVQRAVMDGKSETGVSIMVLTEGMDEGPVVAVERAQIGATESAGELGERLALVGARILPDALRRYVSGDVRPVDQDDDAATYAPKIADGEARIDWSAPLETISNLARGCDPNPGAWTTFRGNRFKVFRLEPAADLGTAPAAGQLLPGPHLVVGTGSGPAVLTDVQPAGKRRMAGDDVARGLRVAAGERFE